jgi:hypothetical protein
MNCIIVSGLLSTLHQTYDSTAQFLWIFRIRGFQLNETLRIFGIVLKVSFLDATCVGTYFPTAIEYSLFVSLLVDVTKVDGVEVT